MIYCSLHFSFSIKSDSKTFFIIYCSFRSSASGSGFALARVLSSVSTRCFLLFDDLDLGNFQEAERRSKELESSTDDGVCEAMVGFFCSGQNISRCTDFETKW